jgi:two-component system NtrC family sensor kinase
MRPRFRVPLLGALLLLLASALAASLVPAGIALNRRVAAELRRVAVEDLGRAPMILEDRNAARAEALSMHAMTVASTPGLVEAVRAGRLDQAAALVTRAANMYGEEPVLVSADGAPVVGPRIADTLLSRLSPGESRVDYVYEQGMPRAVGLVVLAAGGRRLGAAGSWTPLDSTTATALSALARSDVTIVGSDNSVVASTLDSASARDLAAAAAAGGRPESHGVSEVLVAGAPVWVARGEMAGAGAVLFSRAEEKELAALPGVRRGAVLAGLLTLVLALLVGALVATSLSRPAQALAKAADRVAQGDFQAPVPTSRVEELDRLGSAFRAMRESLRSRLDELADANRALEDRQRRLRDLQAELIRQDRLTSSARMAAELAHEIRNPVANVRNCLEVVRRTLPDDAESTRFADMAIDELLRMHELAEQLLDLNRPADAGEGTCAPRTVAGQVATLSGVGESPLRVEVRSDMPDATRVAMPPDALKQILFNLVDNAREASGTEGVVEIRVRRTGTLAEIDVIDEGPGIPDENLPRLFDPFFTTKGAVHGVGLGLFVAEGLARRYGGRMSAGNRDDGRGARFRLEVPVALSGEDAEPAAASGGAQP